MRVYTEEERREKRNAYIRQWKKDNKDKVRLSKSIYRKNNKDKVRLSNSIYRKNNKDKIRLSSSIYRKNNKDKLLIYGRKYRDVNKEKLQAYSRAYSRAYGKKNRHKRRAYKVERKCRIKWATCETSKKARREMIYLISSEVSLETGITHEVDHIIPISKGGLNHEDFLMITTGKYNNHKNNKLDYPLPEMQYLILDDLVQLYLKEVS